jgi:hypothetical protein
MTVTASSGKGAGAARAAETMRGAGAVSGVETMSGARGMSAAKTMSGAASSSGPVPAPVRVLRRTGFTVAADGSYAACLAEAAPQDGPGEPAGAAGPAESVEPTGPPGAAADPSGDGSGRRWFLERWTLAGPEAYAVPLPGTQPEETGTQVVPMPDGRVMLRRRVADRHDVVLLYPTGPGTGELAVCSLPQEDVRLLPPSPATGDGFALVREEATTEVWRLTGPDAPSPVATVRGRCTGGVWLDRAGRLLALDRELDGRTKAVAADLHSGEVGALLQLTDDSDDRLLLAEPGSGLLLLRSDATGETRLGWGVLGSRRPVRFPEALRPDGALLTPVAAQPGQILSPESCVVAFRAHVPGGAESLALWRPRERRLHWRSAPPGWLGPAALWLPGAPLRLPYAAPQEGCALAAYEAPPLEAAAVRKQEPVRGAVAARRAAPVGKEEAVRKEEPAQEAGRVPESVPVPGPEAPPAEPTPAPAVRRLAAVHHLAAVLPLQQAPLTPGAASPARAAGYVTAPRGARNVRTGTSPQLSARP